MEHSKTPWKLYSGKLVPEYPNKIVEVQDENGKAICKWTGFDGADQSPAVRKANAAFIVKACNYHDKLLAALEKAVGRPLDVREIMEINNIVVSDLKDKWQKFAFTLYTMIVEAATEAEDLIAKAGAK